MENIGRNGRPEQFPIPEPGDDQLLVRIDSVGMCFSDVKLIKQGGNHPKLYNRDLAQEPTRLGHEVSLTVIEVGQNLRDRYHHGQRLAVQPDIYQNGKSTAYGYTVPGGLIQYHVIGAEVLDTDAGACLLPLEGEMGYAESSLLEPWGCVVASYTQRRRLEPKAGGIMWIVGQPGDTREYTFSAGLDAPATIVLTDAPPAVKALVAQTKAVVIERNGLQPADYAALKDELTGGKGFDDIVVLDPRSADGRVCHGSLHCPPRHPQPGGRNPAGRPGRRRRGAAALRLHRLRRQPGARHCRLLRRSAQPLRAAP